MAECEMIFSPWSDPIIRPVSTDLTRPMKVTDEEFNVTSFTFRYKDDPYFQILEFAEIFYLQN